MNKAAFSVTEAAFGHQTIMNISPILEQLSFVSTIKLMCTVYFSSFLILLIN